MYLRAPGSLGMLFTCCNDKVLDKFSSLRQVYSPTAKMSFKYVVLICINVGKISSGFHRVCFCDFRVISRIFLKFGAPRLCEISEVLLMVAVAGHYCFLTKTVCMYLFYYNAFSFTPKRLSKTFILETITYT